LTVYIICTCNDIFYLRLNLRSKEKKTYRGDHLRPSVFHLCVAQYQRLNLASYFHEIPYVRSSHTLLIKRVFREKWLSGSHSLLKE
jgi:hypothetical protein